MRQQRTHTHTPMHTFTRRIGALLGAMALAAAIAGCGTRVAHDEVVAAAGGGGGNGVAAGNGTNGGSSSGTQAGGNSSTGSSSGSGGGAAGSGGTSAGGATGSGGGSGGGATGDGTGGGGAAGDGTGGTGTGAGGGFGGAAAVLDGGTCEANLSTVTLGNVGTYSGLIGAILSIGQPALQVWAKYVNERGGLNCHPVRVVSADDGGDPTTAATLTANMVNSEGAIAFIGNMIPLTFQAVNSYVVEHQIPVIGGDSSNEIWFNSPMLFPAGNTYPANADLVVKTMVADGQSKIAYIYCVESPSCSTSWDPGRAPGLGAEIVYSSTISLAQPSYIAQCIGAKNAGAQALMVILDGNGLGRFAGNCASQGYNPTFGAITLALTASVADVPELDGMLIGSNVFPWNDDVTPMQAAMHEAIEQYDPGLQLGGATPTMWTSGMIAVEGSKYLSENPTSAEFLRGLWEIKDNDLGGITTPITYNEGGPATPTNCSFVLRVEDGGFVDPYNGDYVCG